MAIEPSRSIKIFYCYAEQDRLLKDELEKQLGGLKRLGKITTWDNRHIAAGTELQREIDTHFGNADIVLLLISPDFIDSDACYERMNRALEKHKVGKVRVIPLILRPADWDDIPISELQMLPAGGKPVTTWNNRDEAFRDVVKGIREVVKALLAYPAATDSTIQEQRQERRKHTINRHEAVQLFHQLLQPDSQIRILCLAGDGKLGKSHLLTKVFPALLQQQYQARYAVLDLRNRLRTVPDILETACELLGREHFESYTAGYQALTSTTKLECEPVHALSSYFNNPAKNSRDDTEYRYRNLTTQFVNDLKKLDNTLLLLLFDSVNNATESIQTWLMDTLLLQAFRLPQLRVIMAGRCLPEVDGSYAAYCDRYQLTPVKDMEEYIGYCRSLNVQLHEEAIKAFASYVDYIPGTFVECVLPKFA